ncbi:translation initiation factor [Coprinopsis sp. MPI-PUGE-AT-0042]|nr:translation initiation factor [Coprinopsis sp. MPI-PUGE-AT-0042]
MKGRAHWDSLLAHRPTTTRDPLGADPGTNAPAPDATESATSSEDLDSRRSMSGWWWPRRTIGEAREDDGYKAMFGDVKKKKKEIPFDFDVKSKPTSTADHDEDDEGGPVDTSRLDGIDEAELTEDPFAMADAPSGVDIGLELWLGSDGDYSSQELLSRFYSPLQAAHPVLASSLRKRFTVAPPQLFREGMKKSTFANIPEICKNMHRQDQDIVQFLLSEMGTAESVNGAGHLVIGFNRSKSKTWFDATQYVSNASLARLENHPTPPHKGNRIFSSPASLLSVEDPHPPTPSRAVSRPRVGKRSKNKTG